MAVCDGTGQRVATVGTLSLRRATAEQVRAAVQLERRDLYRVNWQPVPLAPSKVASDKVVVVGGEGGLANVLGVSHVADVGGLRSQLDAGETAAERVIFDKTSGPGCALVHEAAGTIELPRAVQAETTRALVELQALLSDARLAKSALVWVTSSAIGTGAAEGVGDLVHAPLWGLLRARAMSIPSGCFGWWMWTARSRPPRVCGQCFWLMQSRSWRGESKRRWRRGFRSWAQPI